jgi:hypothetical protein
MIAYRDKKVVIGVFSTVFSCARFNQAEASKLTSSDQVGDIYYRWNN